MLKTPGRFPYSAINLRPQYAWPGGKKLAVYVTVNVEHFPFGEQVGPDLDRPTQPWSQRSWLWREYGNRVPDVPTIAESGLKDYGYTTWYAMWAPARIPAAVVSRLNQAIHKVSAAPDVRASLQNAGIDPGGATSAQLGERVRADLAKWGRIIRAAGIKGQ